MKKIYLKRALSLSLAAIMAVSATGCGKNKNSATSESESVSHNVKDYVYKEEDIDLGANVDYSSINYLGKFGDKLYAAGMSYTNDDMGMTVYTMGLDGSNPNKIVLPSGATSSITNITIADDGSIYTIENVYGDYSGGEEVDLNSLFGEDAEIVSEEPVAESDSEASEAASTSDTDASDTENSESETEEPESPDTPEIPGAEDADDTETSDDMDDSESGSDDLMPEGDSSVSDGISEMGGAEVSYGGDSYSLVKYSKDGNEEWRCELKNEDGSYFYVGGMVALADKGLILSDTKGIHLYSFDDGSLIKDSDVSEYLDPDYGNSFALFKKEDGSILAAMPSDADMTFFNVDAEAGKVTPIEGAGVSAYDYSFFAGVGSDLLLTDSEAVYSYNVGDTEPKMIMNYVDSDLSTYGMYQVVAISDKSFFCLLPNDSGYTIAIMTKVDPSEVKEKQTITLGCNYIDYDVRARVVKFNKESENYRIMIQDYSKFDTDEEFSGGANKLNTDIVSGNIPDILVLDSDMPVDSYISKGLFQDMTDYFNNDEELSKAKFLDGVMEVFKTDGKMYKIIPSFYIETVVAAKDDVGDKNTWTIDEMEKLVKDKSIEYKNIFGPLSRDEVFEMALSLAGSQFIDWSTQKCSYNSESFIHLLELVNEFPEDLSEDEAFADTSAYWREGKSLASRLYLSGFSDFNYEEQGSYGKELSLVGFPSDNGSGAAIYPNLQLTMSADSKVKDGCWEFIRYFLTDEYQKTVDSAWPISKTRIDELAEQAKKKPTYTDENGKEVEYDDTWYVGETEVIINPMTDDSVNKIVNYMESITQIGNYNDSIRNIINEEAAAYFSGQKTAAEVADIIQSRVQIYVNEIS